MTPPNPSTISFEDLLFTLPEEAPSSSDPVLSPVHRILTALPTPSLQQREAIDTIMNIQRNETSTICFLTGKAGTGKSVTLRHLIEQLNEERIATAVAAPTGAAALNVDGVTIHNLLSFKPEHSLLNVKNHTPLKCLGLRTIIIDEVSMVRADLLDMIDIALRNINQNQMPFGGINIILIGDPAQLPPVVSSTDSRLIKKHYVSEFFFSSEVFRKCAEAELVYYFCLTQVFRQKDATFVSLLDNVRVNAVPKTDLDTLNSTAIAGELNALGTILTKTNRQKDLINNRFLSSLPGATFNYAAQIDGKLQEWQMTFPKVLSVKIGSRVMVIKNIYADSTTLEVFNGDMGTVVEAEVEATSDSPFAGGTARISVLLDRTQKVYTLYPMRWEEGYNEYDSTTHSTRFKVLATVTQIPLVLANAVTVHKAQGQTLENVVIDIREGMGESGMLYTAITRVKTLPGLQTLGRYNKFSFGVNEETVKFLETVEYHNRLSSVAEDALDT